MQKYGELLRALLEKRRITNTEEAEIFLNPDYQRDFHGPFSMKDMRKACQRILEAVDKGERVVIYADYDCDGMPGAVIIEDFFKKIGFENYEVYIPERNSEGYGLNHEAIDRFAADGAKLIITVDLGITAVEEIAYAKKKGIETIIVDHHLPPGSPSVSASWSGLPDAYAILNPKTDQYPEKMLCAAGVAFKLVQGLISVASEKEALLPKGSKASLSASKRKQDFPFPPGWEKWLLDMAGLATLSDMVPLLGENRAMAYFGLKVLRKSRRPGLQKLLQKMRIDQGHLAPEDVGYMLAPKLNAASRMDSPRRAYELLATDNLAEAGALAEHLARINDERKIIVTGIMREANKRLAEKKLAEGLGEVLVLGNPKWRVGVLGLVASRISEEYERPAFVWGRDENDCIRGSCRSDGSVSVVELMSETQEYFTEFGGHELAGGFAADAEKIHFLEEALRGAFGKVKKEKPEAGPEYDLALPLSEVTMKNWKEIEKMEPFGLGNPKPVFLFEKVRTGSIKKFGKNGGEHLEITFSDGRETKVKAVSFFSGEDSFKVDIFPGAYVNLLASFDLSRFLGREELRLRIIDIL